MKLFDCHCDTLTECLVRNQPLARNTLAIDFERGFRYQPWVQVFAAWIPDTLRGNAAYAHATNILDLAEETEKSFPGRFRIVRSAADLPQGEPAPSCQAIMAVEGGAALGGQLQRIRALADRSVKILTLTWNGENELGYGCRCDGNRCDGLKPFGKAAVRELERCGIVPDVSHLNEAGFWDAAEAAEGALIASHSVSAACHEHPRNLTDDQFREIVRRDGLVGLNLCESQLGEQSFDCLRRHLDHFLELGGENILGFGGDFDGTDMPPEWGGIAVMESLGDYFIRKNYEESFLEKLFFDNCYNFFRRALTKA